MKIREYQRKHQRLRAPFIMKILTYNHQKVSNEYCVCAEGLNISPGGLSFKYPRVISKDSHLRALIYDIPRLKGEEIIANLKIVWVEKKDALSRRYGAKFLKIQPEKKYKLLRTLRKNGGY